MPDFSLDEAARVLRHVATYMAPTAADSTAVRVAKEAFRLSALVMVASVVTCVVISPERQLTVT